MLTVEELRDLARRLDGKRTLTVYLALPTDSPAGSGRTLFRQGIAGLRDGLTWASHSERARFEASADRLAMRIGDRPAPFGGGTWVGIATSDGDTYDEWLPAIVPTTFAWENRVRIGPYYAGAEHPAAVIAVVEREHAAFYRHTSDVLASIESWETPASASAGPHIVRVVDRLRALTGADEWIVLFGTPELVSCVAANVSEELGPRLTVAGPLAPDVEPHVIREALRPALERLRAGHELGVVSDVLRRLHSPAAAVSGRDAALGAAAQGAIEHLIMSDRLLADDGAAAEDLMRSALATGARLTFAGGDAGARLSADADGVAAVLRFPATVGASV